MDLGPHILHVLGKVDSATAFKLQRELEHEGVIPPYTSRLDKAGYDQRARHEQLVDGLHRALRQMSHDGQVERFEDGDLVKFRVRQ